jgi:hypothetical protein
MRPIALLPFQKMLLLEAADPEPKSHGVRGKTPPSGSRRFVVLLPSSKKVDRFLELHRGHWAQKGLGGR